METSGLLADSNDDSCKRESMSEIDHLLGMGSSTDQPVIASASLSAASNPCYVRRHVGNRIEMMSEPNCTSSVDLSADGDGRSCDPRCEPLVLEHCHGSDPPSDDSLARKQLIAVSILCFIFMLAEIVGGLMAGSLAVATDATHMASDLAGFLISLFAIWLSKKPATTRLSFGFYRAEVLGALISVLIIWVVTAVLIGVAVHRIQEQNFEIEGTTMLVTACVGVAFNVAMGAVLHSGLCKQCNVKSSFGHGHSHGGGGHSHGGHSHGGRGDHHSHGVSSHGHSHGRHRHDDDHSHVHSSAVVLNSQSGSRTGNGYSTLSLETINDDDGLLLNEACDGVTTVTSANHEQQRTNINVRAAMVHVIGDLIQSLGVLIAAIVVHVRPEYKIADPICTFIFSFLVLCTTLGVLRDVIVIVMEGVPRDLNYHAVKSDLAAIAGVRSVHSLNIWSLTLDRVIISVHLAVACVTFSQLGFLSLRPYMGVDLLAELTNRRNIASRLAAHLDLPHGSESIQQMIVRIARQSIAGGVE